MGQAIAGRRADAFVATKVFPILPLGPIVEQRGRASSERLGVDQIDLYQVHWPNPGRAAGHHDAGHGAACVEKGAVRHVGVSNFNLRQWQTAERQLGGAGADATRCSTASCAASPTASCSRSRAGRTAA